MTKGDHSALIARLEAEPEIAGDDIARIVAALEAAFAGRTLWSGPPPEALTTTDGVLALIAGAMPSWSVKIRGNSASMHGRWTATIREAGVRDDDELIGVGKARTLPNALLAALLEVIELRDVVI